MKRPLRFFILTFLTLVSGLLMVFGAVVWVALEDLPDVRALKDYKPPQGTVVFDRNGELLGRFFDERRTVISLKKLPAHVTLAFLAAEDGDFYEHHGIDYFGLVRAIILEIKHRTIGGRRVGGSTITQQTARTMLLSSRQTYVRKIKEIVLAQRIENALTKEQILHLYLNQIYFGNGAYGIEEAAQTYFRKPAQKLLLHESAILASIPKSPNRINPFNDVERLRQRQHYVLDQMAKLKFIEPKDCQVAKDFPIVAPVADPSDKVLAPYFMRAVKVELLPKVGDEAILRGGLKIYSTLDIDMQKRAEAALTRGLRALDKQTGYRGPLFRPASTEAKKFIEELSLLKKRLFGDHDNTKIWDLSRLNRDRLSKDLKNAFLDIGYTRPAVNKIIGAIVVLVNDKIQNVKVDLGSSLATLPFHTMSWARPVIKGKKMPLTKPSDVFQVGDIILVKLQSLESTPVVSLEQEPEINGGLVALDIKTGGVRAMVGGYDFERSPYNRVTQAKRQPGSGIKPFVYGLAIDREIFTAASILTDAPKAFLDPSTNDFWRPRNHNNKFLGDITFRRCLKSSINICTIMALEEEGIDEFLRFAQEVRLNTKATPYPRNLTIALGSAENYPIDFANAMRIFPNNGLYSDYHLIDAIKYQNGELENTHVLKERRVLRPEAAFIITHILRDVISESKKDAHLFNVRAELAGKTGTTNKARSTWFTGYSNEILASVYVGHDDNRETDGWGITQAFPMFAEFMNSLPVHREELRFNIPDNIEWRLINRDTGKPVALYPDRDSEVKTVFEAFIAGTAPDFSSNTESLRASPEINDEAAFAP